MNKELRELNEKLNSYERAFGMEALRSFPVFVGVPAGDRCNLECIFCTDRSKDCSYQYKNTSFDEFLMFSQPLSFANYIQIQGWGEPLVNPDYEKILDFMTSTCKGACTISFNTNGTLLNERWIDKIASVPNLLINISLNASSRETYESIMKQDCFNEVVKNIRSLVRKRDQKGCNASPSGKRPLISISMVAMRQNVHEIPRFVSLAADLGADYAILRDLIILRKERLQDSLYFQKNLTSNELKQAFAVAKARGIALDTTSFPVGYFLPEVYCIDPQYTEYSRWRPFSDNCLSSCNYSVGECCDPWTSFVLDSSGDVKVCCYSETIMGNIFKQSFSEIWNGDMYRYYRRNVNSINPPKDCTNCIKKRVWSLPQSCEGY